MTLSIQSFLSSNIVFSRQLRAGGTVAALLCLAACAKSTGEIAPQYVSPMQYKSYDCEQIEMEMQTLSRRISQVGGQVDETASTDKAQTAIGILLLWPTLFFLDGDTPQAAEYSRLRGEFDALQQSATQKKCNIHVPLPPVTTTTSTSSTENKPAFPNSRRR